MATATQKLALDVLETEEISLRKVMNMTDFDARAAFFEQQEIAFAAQAKAQMLVGDWNARFKLSDNTGSHQCHSSQNYAYARETETGFQDEPTQIALAFLRKDKDAMARAERWIDALAAMAAKDASDAIARSIR